MIQLDPYLFFDGTCAEAMRFYERTLSGKLETLMTQAESPMAGTASPGDGDRILHARLVFDGRVLMASDWMAARPFERMQGFALSLSYPNVADARRVFDAFAAGGRVTAPLEKTFWAEAFGMLVDRFGTPWMVSGGTTSA